MKTRDSSPPVHVHVAESTPVHVHLKKSPKSCTYRPAQMKTREVQIKGDVVSLRTTAKTKTRVPWIPPGRTSTRQDVYKWEGPSHCLEITTGSPAEPSLGPLQLEDLSDEDEEGHSHRKRQGMKIDRLMMDAESSKEAMLRKKERDQSELLRAHQRKSGDQDEELGEQNMKECHSLKMRGDYERADSGKVVGETDLLLRKLVEAEIDSMAVANQLEALKETVGKGKDKLSSKMNSSSLRREQELLKKKIDTFDSTNRHLRELLRECHERETESLKLSEQRHALLRRLADTEDEKMRLLSKLNNKEKEATKLALYLDSEKDNVKANGELSKILESTRSRLISQLHCKEDENDRLIAQIQSMELTQEAQRKEMQGWMEKLQELKHQNEESKEIHRHETQTLKQRAKHSEDSARELSTQLLEKESQLAEALSTAEAWCARHSTEASAKSQLDMDVTALRNQVRELTDQLYAVEQKNRAEKEGLLDQLHRLNSDNTKSKLENQSLKASLSAAEEKLARSHSEAHQLKTSIKKHESLMDKYKCKFQKARSESVDHCLKLDAAGKEARELKANLEREIEHVRRQLLGRLKELEPLPERLRSSELQLREAQEQVDAQERRNMEQNSTLAELRHKVDQQVCRVEAFQENNLLLQEENRHLKHKMESLERKVEEANLQNRDMAQVIAQRDDSIHSKQQQLEDRARECSILSKQLEQVLEDAQRQVGESHERALSKERSSQSKALDLESQLGMSKAELSQLRRNKEDMERRFQSQLKNLKDRLEQSDCTNRSLQNYVQFLKTSYSNVFGDSGLTSTLFPPSPI
ncbi:outer dense fiber protein 2-like isoform X1 [Osmerus eperlanus]|uniref:outer dense fiber protein 2-like isoform X1 n=1 Tax=Osmerus eperlanus TaxID=29151 RepID=UPI002E13517F